MARESDALREMRDAHAVRKALVRIVEQMEIDPSTGRYTVQRQAGLELTVDEFNSVRRAITMLT
jgi:hypothetical protein